jgi:hypothetical protein
MSGSGTYPGFAPNYGEGLVQPVEELAYRARIAATDLTTNSSNTFWSTSVSFFT